MLDQIDKVGLKAAANQAGIGMLAPESGNSAGKAGEFMPRRVGMEFCKMMDLPECIAEETGAYAQKAVQIASNQPMRDTINAKILKNRQVLYENLQPIDD